MTTRRRSGRARAILHVIPRCVGGGPERSIIALARESAAAGVDHRHTIAVLDPPVTPTMVIQTRRAGVDLVIDPDRAELCERVAAADAVVVDYWNHPALTACLRSVVLPPTRVLLSCSVLGTTAPQVLTDDIARFADRIIVTSESSFASEGCRTAAAAHIPVDFVPALNDRTRLVDFTPASHEGVVVGYLGIVSDAKMHPRFAQLCAAVTDPRVRFVVYGGGGGEDALRSRLAALGIADRVDVRGPTEDIATALAGMDVFGYPLAPGTSATTDKALQEAMWVGLPPVVVADRGASALVVDGDSGLVVTEERYAQAIDRLAADPALRARLGSGARDRARSVFDPARHAATVVAVIEELVARPRRVRPRLPGGDDRPGAGFVLSLGKQAAAFAVSLRGLGPTVDEQQLADADRAIAASSTVVARGEGGVIHHRNTYPEDPHLRLWSGLVAAGAGDRELAVAEFRAAEALGLGDGRAARYADEQLGRAEPEGSSRTSL
jgi:glycosyltransferase involved in cell wall biosynthesis